jgi:hypothetical protein
MCQARAVPARLLACILLALLVAGCGRIRRTGQCVNVISTLNTALDDVAGRVDSGGGNAEGEREIAARYDTLASDLEAQPIDSPELKTAVNEYRALARDTARLLRNLADARSRNHAMPMALAKRELANSTRREKALVARIDAACQSP